MKAQQLLLILSVNI